LKNPRIHHGENLVFGTQNNLIVGYQDNSRDFPAWNIPLEYWKHPLNYSQEKNVDIKLINQGPIFATIEIKRILGKSPISQLISIFKEDPIIYCQWCADWQEENALLKVGLETNTMADTTYSDQMYCSLPRSTLPKTPCDKARYEKIMHRYADISTPTNQWGITLLNEGKYAYDAFGDQIRLTLHRSPAYPGPSGESWANKERQERLQKDNSKPPSQGGMGAISCRYAYYPHQGGALFDANHRAHNIVMKAAEEFNNPVMVTGNLGTGVIENLNLDIYSPMNVQVSTLKYKEWEPSKNIIIRTVEISGQKETHANLLLPKWLAERVAKVQAVDLLERPIEFPLEWNPGLGEIKFKIQKFEIISFELIIK
jgi:alpha-mannosidase